MDGHFEEALMTAILAVMVAVLTAQVICRKVLGNSLQWSEELCRYLFIWSGFLSLSYTIHNHSPMKTELFVDLCPKGVQRWIRAATELGMLALAVPVGVVLLAVCLFPAMAAPSSPANFAFVIRQMVGGLESTPLLAVPMFVLSGVVMAKGGIYSSVVTLTEAAVLSVVYALIVSLFIYRTLDAPQAAL